jgi:tRNA-Thr(GGU) m(6)t(6)A37 methyltransferase TsaA
MKIYEFKAIGVIHSPYETTGTIPIQAAFSQDEGAVEIFENYVDGLKDIEGFSHIILVYAFHESKGFSLHVKPFLDTQDRGLFATRHPNRPNPVGISIVELVKREGNILRIRGMDVIDGTPLLDIKPYVPRFDGRTDARYGWLEDKLER